MSTTAGLGSGDYAAVSPLAVASIIISLLGTAAYFSDFLLILPVVGIFVGVMALRQIRNSNGTVTGREWAFAGLGIGVLALSVLGGMRVYTEIKTGPDRQAVRDTLIKFDQAVAAGDTTTMYNLHSPTFRSKVTRKAFDEQFALINGNPDFGKLTNARWNEKYEFLNPEATGGGKAVVVGLHLQYSNKQGFTPIVARMIPVGDAWLIDENAQMFPEPKQSRR